jgi:hypothetical protein
MVKAFLQGIGWQAPAPDQQQAADNQAYHAAQEAASLPAQSG